MSAFRWGVVTGLLLPILIVGGLKAWVGPELFRPQFNVEVISDGVSVSRHGGAKVVVLHEQGVVAEQKCLDGCDDIQLQASSGDNSYWVRVLDDAGACIACSTFGMYVTSGYGAAITRWTVAGDDQLKIGMSTVDRKADGSFEEKPFTLQKTSETPGPASDAISKR